LAAYDFLMELPKLDKPVNGIRVIFYPDPSLPGGGWGSGPKDRRARPKGPPASTPADEQQEKGTFVLTAIAATAGAIANEQINLHKLERISHTTASSWDAKYPPAGCLDPRNESGWSPDLKAHGDFRAATEHCQHAVSDDAACFRTWQKSGARPF
jgi:hypothetical protein